MKAISLWQPFATFMRCDLKWNETRNRLTHYRGDLAICSAKRNWVPFEFGSIVEEISHGIAKNWYDKNKLKPESERELLFPKGYVLCVVEVVDCKPTKGLNVSPLESAVGDYSAGRFAWITRNCRPLQQPVFVKGHQGFFNLPADVEAKVLAQIK